MLIENTQSAPEAVSMDISTTLLALGGSVDRMNEATSLRLKMKYCALCDSVCARTGTISSYKDMGDRHNILDIVMEWIQEPMPVCFLSSDIPFHLPRWLAFFSQSSHADAIRAQVDLNRACLRTAIKLLDRLQLRPLDGSAGDDLGHVVARLFNRYSSILLKCLDICQLDLPVRSKARLESSSIF
jgi:hypothetical protein